MRCCSCVTFFNMLAKTQHRHVLQFAYNLQYELDMNPVDVMKVLYLPVNGYAACPAFCNSIF